MLKLITYPDPLLRRQAARMTSPPDPALVLEMYRLMKALGGVGLASNQVGLLGETDFFILDRISFGTLLGKPKSGPYVCCNASWRPISRKSLVPEGCLSVSGIQGRIRRWDQISVEYQDNTFRTCRLEASGLLAQVFQHETDHLQGRLFLDLMSAGTLDRARAAARRRR